MLGLLAAVAVLVVPEFDPARLQPADIVLHTSTSAQSLPIAIATASPYTHVGLVERRGDAWWVLEAVQPVRRTPLAAWVARGAGGRVTVMRHPDLDDDARAAALTAARGFLGRPYDLAFAPGDAALYCSELVRLAYAAAGLEVGAWQPVGELALAHPLVRRLLEERWHQHPACSGEASLAACTAKLAAAAIVTPASLRVDPRLRLVASSYPPATR